MGIEIEVPYRNIGNIDHIRVPIYPGTNSFKLSWVGDYNLELDRIEYLSQAIEWFYYKPRAPIISKVIDVTGSNISLATIKSATTTRSFDDHYTMTLELLL